MSLKSADPALPADKIGTDSELERVAAAIRAHTGERIATFSCDVRDPARVDTRASERSRARGDDADVKFRVIR